MTERAGDAPLRNPGFTVQQTQGGGQSRITHGQEEYRPNAPHSIQCGDWKTGEIRFLKKHTQNGLCLAEQV